MEKPKIKLKHLGEIAVETPTQEIFDRIMRVCECGNWFWFTKRLPTEVLSNWNHFKENTYVVVQNPLMYGSKFGSQEKNYTRINENAFYEKQNIDKEQRKNIEKYFRLNKK